MTWRILLWMALAAGARGAGSSPPPLIAISLDGFRWDYCDLHPGETANLRRLRQEGVTARGLIPVFPSNTFPNHYSIVTGLYPAHHGIVNNEFFDPARRMFFRYFQASSVHDPAWWQGEPIWATAIRQGRTAAVSFWVGSEAEVAGVRPTYWRSYDASTTFEQRLAEVTTWMRQPPAQRPAVIAFYLEETNGAGHRFGPASPELVAAIRLCDERVGRLIAEVRSAGAEPNVMIVSDHGMTEITRDRTILLDEFIDLKTVQIDSDGSVLALRPIDGKTDALMAALAKLPHARAYRREEMPARFHFQDGSDRIAPVWVLPEEGWHLVTRATFERLRRRFTEKGYLAGDHGYDPALASMRGIFIAHGPAFRRGVELPEMENVHLYNLMCAVAKLRPAPNDGDDRLVRAALR